MKLDNGKFEGPQRIWKPDMLGPGQMMTRSFGDTEGHEIGMNCIPDISVEPLVESGLTKVAVVVASDGIWEVVPYKKIAEMVMRYIEEKDSKLAAGSLCELAMEYWQEKEGDGYRDDITCIVAYL